MQLSPSEMANIYERMSKERRGETLNTRVPRRIKGSVEKLARYWTVKERIASKDPDVEVSLGDVVVRLLDLGLAAAWEEAKISPDPTDDQVQQLIQELKNSAT